MAAKPISAAHTATGWRAIEAERLSRVHRCAWAIVASVPFVVLLHFLFRRGMFWDGVLYATIARNLAAGTGSFWHPVVTGTFMPHFHEHPPLAFWLEGAFFYVLGDHLWVERFYGAICCLVTATTLACICAELLRHRPAARACAWLAIGLWIPCSLWCYLHNMLENTSGLFAVVSVYASLRSQTSVRWWHAWAALAGAAITAACLAKGPAGAFPLATPLIAWSTLRRTSLSKACLGQAIVVGSAALLLALFLISDTARGYLGDYWSDQVLSSLYGAREKVVAFPGPFTILLFVARDLLPAAGAAGGLLLLGMLLRADRSSRNSRPIRGKGHRFANCSELDGTVELAARRQAACGKSELGLQPGGLAGPRWFCWLTACSASFPFVLCPKQAGHYATPSFGFFGLALALTCLPAVLRLLPRLSWLERPWALRGARIAALALVSIASWIACRGYGQSCRDRSAIETADQIARFGQPHKLVAIARPSWEKLGENDRLKLHVYLYRYHQMSLTADEAQPAFQSEHFRLELTDWALVGGFESIVTSGGVVCTPIFAREAPDVPRTTHGLRRL